MPEPSNDAWPDLLVELYRDRYTDLVRVAYLIVGRVAVAEEVTQEAFVSCRTKVATAGSPYGYLRAAVVNRARSWHRHQEVVRRKAPAPAEPTLMHPDEMWDALGRLDERRRTAIVLRFYEGLPDDEIATILDCARPTVRTLIHRGLADLRQEMDR